jgi:hypothetical protein
MSLVDRFLGQLLFQDMDLVQGFSGYRIKVWFFGQVSIGFVIQRNDASGSQKIEPFAIVV